MSTFLETLRGRYKLFWTNENKLSLALSAVLFTLATIIQGFADSYVGRIKGVAVEDLILSHLPFADIDTLIIQTSLLLTIAATFLFLFNPKYWNFCLKSLAMFVIIRAGLITLTHLGAIPHEVVFDTDNLGYGLYNILYNTHNDFFFSAHTGIPFLLALIFWPEISWRHFFILMSVIFAISVLVARIHYSIDVFAAPFITYSIFELSAHLFKKDFEFSRTKYSNR